MAYSIYDILTERVRDYKTHLSSCSTNDDPPAATTLHESNVNLYRYGGFALHSLLKKYSHHSPPSDEHTTSLVILRQLNVSDSKEFDKLPSAIHHLNHGGLNIIKPCMLPYLRILIEKVSLLINDDKRDEFGKQMIEIACKELDKDSDIFRTFIKCIQEAHIDVKAPSNALVIPKLNKELNQKMFHARINEYNYVSINRNRIRIEWQSCPC